MATAESPSRLSTVVLFGKGLTPGKLRGLQRISNPNGTLTMVALDQNSSMIEMAAKALKGKGQDREPTYEEIVEAKVDLARHLAATASGVLIDAYYGAWSCVAAGAIGPQTGLAGASRDVGQPQKQGGAPLGLIEPGWSVEKIKLMGADAVKLLAQYEPTEPHLGRAPVPADRARLHRMPEARHSHAARDRGVSIRRRKENGRWLLEPESRDGDRVGPPAQPILRHLQGGVPRYDGPRLRQPASRKPPRAECGQRTALGAACRRASITPTTTSRCRWPWTPAPRAFWVVERSGRSISSRTARKRAASLPRPPPSNAWLTSIRWSASAAPLGSPATVSPRKTCASIRATEGWHARYGSAWARPGRRPSKGAPGEVY